MFIAKLWFRHLDPYRWNFFAKINYHSEYLPKFNNIDITSHDTVPLFFFLIHTMLKFLFIENFKGSWRTECNVFVFWKTQVMHAAISTTLIKNGKRPRNGWKRRIDWRWKILVETLVRYGNVVVLTKKCFFWGGYRYQCTCIRITSC